jgi:ABC-2 type transport system ATP-binding protein
MIQVRSLTKSYGSTHALAGIDFTIGRGEICGYIGPNGAGKSTTVKILTGILPPDAGSVSVAGIDVVREPDKVKPLIGYVPETGGVFEALTASEYLRFAGRLHGMSDASSDRRSELLLEYFGLSRAANAMMTTYSKGMKQKVVIATALLHDPDVYFFDEPLDGLDAQATLLFKELIRSLSLRGKTILYCSHLLDIVERVCTRMIVLRDGNIIAQGNITELRELTSQETLEEAFSILTDSEDAEQKTLKMLEQLERIPV